MAFKSIDLDPPPSSVLVPENKGMMSAGLTLLILGRRARALPAEEIRPLLLPVETIALEDLKALLLIFCCLKSAFL